MSMPPAAPPHSGRQCVSRLGGLSVCKAQEKNCRLGSETGNIQLGCSEDKWFLKASLHPEGHLDLKLLIYLFIHLFTHMEYSLSTSRECSEPEGLSMSHASCILDTYSPHPVCQSSSKPFFYLNQVESFEYYAHAVLFLHSPMMQIASNVMINWRRLRQPMTWVGNSCPQRIPWTEEPGGLSSIGSQRVGQDWSDLACTHWRMRGCCRSHSHFNQRWFSVNSALLQSQGGKRKESTAVKSSYLWWEDQPCPRSLLAS